MCPIAEEALSQLADKYTSSKLIFLEYHPPGDGLGNNKSIERMAGYYGVPYTPVAIFDGVERIPGAGEGVINEYEKIIQKRLNVAAPLSITLLGELKNGTGTVTGKFTWNNSPALSNLKIRWVIYEDKVQEGGKIYRFIVRDILTEDKLSIKSEQTVTVTKPISLNPKWNLGNVGVVAFIQNDSSKEVLQSAVFKANK